MSSNIIWTSTEAEAVTGGKSTQDWYATGVSMSLDELKPGDLYIATPEDDLNVVFQRGAAAAMVPGKLGEGCEYPLLKVGSVFQALQDLARAARFKTHASILSIQGRDARDTMHEMLSLSGSVYEGGRHLSLGLAGLPEGVDYGLFGSSPAVQPDIAVVTNCTKSNRDTLFETMPISGTVLINTDEGEFLPVIARAKAAGIRNIYTYGAHEHADAHIVEWITANNGMRLSLKILDEEHAFTLEGREAPCAAFIASLLILKLTGKSLAQAIKQLETASAGPVLSDSNIELIAPEFEKAGLLPQAVFKVTNMIDLGFGRQTAVLDNFANFSQKSLCFPKKDLVIPRRVETLDLMYTSKTVGAVRNAQDAIKRTHKNAQLENISPDAVAPGDFVVFKDIRKHTTAIFSEALRLIPKPNSRKLKADHAV